MKFTVKALKASVKSNTKWWRRVAREAAEAERRVQPLLKPLAAALSVPYDGVFQPTVAMSYTNSLLVELPIRNFHDVLPLLEALEACGVFGMCDETEDHVSMWGGHRRYMFHRDGATLLSIKAFPAAADDDEVPPGSCRVVQVGERQLPPEPVYQMICP